MKDIYSRSTLNIAASDAHDSTKECFLDVKEDVEREITQFDVFVSSDELELRVKIQADDCRRSTKYSVINDKS